MTLELSKEKARRFSGSSLFAHLMAQNGVPATLLEDEATKDQGLLSRFLVTAPQSLRGECPYRDPSPESLRTIDAYNAHLLNLLAVPLPVDPRLGGALTPRVISQSASAKSLWISFHDEINAKRKDGGEFASINGLAAKLAEHAERIAGVLALVENLDAGTIEARHQEGAIELARHYGAEALRMFGTPAQIPDLVRAQELGAWLLKNWSGKLVSAVEVYQFGPNALRDAATAKRMRTARLLPRDDAAINGSTASEGSFTEARTMLPACAATAASTVKIANRRYAVMNRTGSPWR